MYNLRLIYLFMWGKQEEQIHTLHWLPVQILGRKRNRFSWLDSIFGAIVGRSPLCFSIWYLLLAIGYWLLAIGYCCPHHNPPISTVIYFKLSHPISSGCCCCCCCLEVKSAERNQSLEDAWLQMFLSYYYANFPIIIIHIQLCNFEREYLPVNSEYLWYIYIYL